MSNDTAEPPLTRQRPAQRRGRPPSYDPEQICQAEDCGRRRGDDPGAKKWCRGLCRHCYNSRSRAATRDQAPDKRVTASEFDWDAAIARLRIMLAEVYGE